MANEKMRISLSGKKVDKDFSEQEVLKHFTITDSYELSANRSDARYYEEELDETKIIQLITDDEVEWIGLADDLPTITNKEVPDMRSGESVSFNLTQTFSERGHTDRGVGEKVRNAIFNIINSKGTHHTALEVAGWIDDLKAKKPGFFKVSKNGKLVDAVDMPSDKNCLLFIHGTVSSFEGGFGGMLNVLGADNKPALWESIYERYDGDVYAFNHRTISESPMENAVQLLNELPENVTMDSVSHSRGGLIGDILSRCDHRNPKRGYMPEDIELIDKEFEHGTAIQKARGNRVSASMLELNKIAAEKNILINKHVRVACPAAGTVLLDNRMDHFLNALLNLLGKAVGGKLNPLYQYFKLFVLKVVEKREDPDAFPGLWSMVPKSTFQVINNRDFEVSCDLISVTGDAKVGSGFLHSLKVILTNLYYLRENDFVVNTSSMNKGLINRRSNVFYKIQNRKVHHSNYFSEKKHLEIVFSALNNTEIKGVHWKRINTEGDRGVADLLAKMGELEPMPASGKRPIVVLLPGIMGTNLYEKVQGKYNRVWLDFAEIRNGAMTEKMNVNAGISTQSVIAKYYKKLEVHLRKKGHDVVVFPYDWRKSLEDSVEEFGLLMETVQNHGQPVRIMAHSMGGIMVRQWMVSKPDQWDSYKSRSGSKFIMLGTPWRGSYLMMEVLTGHSRKVWQLHWLDKKNNKRSLLDSLVQHKGLYDLLPLDDDTLDNKGTWTKIDGIVGSRDMAPIPDELLQYFQEYKDKVDAYKTLSDEDRSIIYYVAGKDKKTLSGYKFKRSFWKGEHLDYYHTAEGDGSVTWSAGIPANILPDHLYYTNVVHGNLANEENLFAGLLQLIEQGKTSSRFFSSRKLRSSGGSRGLKISEAIEMPTSMLDNTIADNIFGINTYDDDSEVDVMTNINVEVFNGDLKWAKYPIMVGHFKHDGIVSAERAIDRYLDNKLSERHMMGFYPGKIGEQDIIIDPMESPKGAIIIGLGDKDELTGYLLSKSVEKAILRYAVVHRDNHLDLTDIKLTSSVSALIVGSNYGKLPMKESIRSILVGIKNANSIIEGFDDLKQIDNVEFVDYYEDNAYECFKVLQEIEGENNSIYITLKNDIKVGYRNKKRLLRDESQSWWQSFSTELKKYKDDDCKDIEYLDFGTYNRLASSSRERVYSDLNLAKYIAEELSTKDRWDKESSKAIFEMLLPNRYKDFIRNHRNIEWRMDVYSAAIPWEMFHDNLYGDHPTFIESGLIRQLYSMDANVRPAMVRAKNALVIANPIFKPGGLKQLEGAEEEGKLVRDILLKHEYDVQDLIQSNPVEITTKLFAGRYKVIHIASHGLFDVDENRVGIAIGDGQLLTPGTIKQITAIPELVFINCCFSGTMDPKLEAYYKNRNRLAANVGTQLIEIGVKAVVVAGWAVNDDAAATFAEVFYNKMMSGEQFGDAVTSARYQCYTLHSEFNTWGAYQCYGDQFYVMNRGGGSSSSGQNYSLSQEIIIELDNILSHARSLEFSKGKNSIKDIEDDAENLLSRAEELGIRTSEIIEREAKIYSYLGKYEHAVECYHELFKQDDGNYQVTQLDVFCNISAKHLVQQAEEGHISKAEIRKELRSLLKRLKSISNVGEGPRLLASKGSTYKRAARLAENRTDKGKYLEIAARHYLNAAKIRGVLSRDSIYHYTSFIALAHICNAERKNDMIDITEEIGTSYKKYLTGWIGKTEKNSGDRADIYDQLAYIQLRTCSIIIGSGNRSELTDEIIEQYRKQIDRCINIRDLLGEIEYINFFLFMIAEFKDELGNREESMIKIKDFLDSYLQ